MRFFFIGILFTFTWSAFCQCPANIDFETGAFNNWKCYAGDVYAINGQNSISVSQQAGPVANQHTLLVSNAASKDAYGGFPLSSPNGSQYIVKLGNTAVGHKAEAISYDLTIPVDRNSYSIVYYYAIVFQDPIANHQNYEQPRMKIDITNVTDNQLISCSSFDFAPYLSKYLPGFVKSPIQAGNTDVYYKAWTPVTVNLNNMAGKTVRLMFYTADCTHLGHFGYAYIDVNTDCGREFGSASFCKDDTVVTLSGPYGYNSYTWYDSTFKNVLSSQQMLDLKAPFTDNALIPLVVVPYSGFGCTDTLYARLKLQQIKAIAGRDTVVCNGSPVQLGTTSIDGLNYAWLPAIGLSSNSIANPVAQPSSPTRYILSVSSATATCNAQDTVFVDVKTVDTSVTFTGKNLFCAGSLDSAVLTVPSTGNIQWYRDNILINGATSHTIRIKQSGNYTALISSNGCFAKTATINVTVETPTPGIRYPARETVYNLATPLAVRSIAASATWAPAIFLDNPASLNPVFTGNRDMEYLISFRSAAGCITVDTQYVRVFAFVKFFIPTAFTPNRDGLNDYIRPIAAGMKEIRYFRIYNRWGQLVFDLNSNAFGWDGTIAGRPADSQVFVWAAEGVGVDEKIYFQKGTVTLIR